jgi:hypothetical protein
VAVDVAAGFVLAFSRLPLSAQGRVLRFVQEFVADPNSCSHRLMADQSDARIRRYEIDSRWLLLLTESHDGREHVLVDLVRSQESGDGFDTWNLADTVIPCGVSERLTATGPGAAQA